LPHDALILGFDTSAAHCAAALLSGDRLVAQAQEPMEKGQAERLMPFLEEMLSGVGIGWSDLTALAVGTGPGNFTGVRIAVAAARGLALGLGIPAVGVTTFEAIAHGAPRPVVAMRETRRDQLYLQVFGHGDDTVRPVVAGELLDLPAGAAFVGDNAIVGAAYYRGRALRPAYSLAEAVARVAATRLGSPQPRPAPFYLRAADAAPPADPPPLILP
jgi:tRNA threonylcarbamoyladenosine biosynthesis protein TsaB